MAAFLKTPRTTLRKGGVDAFMNSVNPWSGGATCTSCPDSPNFTWGKRSPQNMCMFKVQVRERWTRLGFHLLVVAICSSAALFWWLFSYQQHYKIMASLKASPSLWDQSAFLPARTWAEELWMEGRPTCLRSQLSFRIWSPLCQKFVYCWWEWWLMLFWRQPTNLSCCGLVGTNI